MGCSNSNVREKEKDTKPANDSKNIPAQKSQSKSEEEIKIIKGAEKFYSGVLADNASFYGESLFTNQEQVDEFKSSIASQVLLIMDNGNGGKPKNIKNVKNDSDPFLNGEVKIDFSRQRLIVCRGSCLSSIEEKEGKISITFDNVTMVRENYYYAYVVNSRLYELDLGINNDGMYNNNVIIDQRPINNNRIIEQRPINNNVIIEQRVINKNVIIEQRPINNNDNIENNHNLVDEEFCEPPDEYADGNKENNINNEYGKEVYAEGENNDYEEA